MSNLQLRAVVFLVGGLAGLVSAAPQSAIPLPAAVSASEARVRFVDLFRPLATERAALSPDGKYLAYTTREADKISVTVVEIDHPEVATAKVVVVSDEQSTEIVSQSSRENSTSRVGWMRWVTPTRLALETNQVQPTSVEIGFLREWVNARGTILAFDADGKNAKVLLTPKDVRESMPDPTDPFNVLAMSGFNNDNGAPMAGVNSANRGIIGPGGEEEGESLSLDADVRLWREKKAVSGPGFISLPRTPRVVGLSDSDPNCVIVQAEGALRTTMQQSVTRFELNVFTGKTKTISDQLLNPAFSYLFDSQGESRLNIPRLTSDAFPHRIRYRTEKIINSWRPLDELAGTKGIFAVSPENYFGVRAVPLQFSHDTGQLYYASNAGRDTFGIYSIDLKTWARGHLTIENPNFDLYSPQDGMFPFTELTRFSEPDDAFVEQYGFLQRDAGRSGEAASTQPGRAFNNQASPENVKYSLLQAKYLAKEMFQRIEKNARRVGAPLGSNASEVLVYDRFKRQEVGIRFRGQVETTRWFSPKLQGIQDALERLLPGRSVIIREWDQAENRFLVQAQGGADSGSFYVFDEAQKSLRDLARRAPWLDRTRVPTTTAFVIAAADGKPVSGTLTFPHAARMMPVPVVVLCTSFPWERARTEFQPELQALAEMGFAVVQVNSRATWGFGTKAREAYLQKYEDGQIEDILLAVQSLSKRYAVNTKKIAIVGEQHGGYVALRALQLQPDHFRCAIAINSMIDLDSWIRSSRWRERQAGPSLVRAFLADPKRFEDAPLRRHPDLINNPVLLLSHRGWSNKSESEMYLETRSFATALEKRNVPVEFYDLSDDYIAGGPQAKAQAFRHIEDFLNVHLYEYKVKLGELRELKD